MAEINKYSKTLTQDQTQPAAQAMLYGIGLTDHDLKKAQVGIASMGYEGNTCNMHLNDLAKVVKQGVWDNDLVGLIFNTIGVSDGMSNGTNGMRYSLVSTRSLMAAQRSESAMPSATVYVDSQFSSILALSVRV